MPRRPDRTPPAFLDLKLHLPTPLTTVGVDKREMGAAAVRGVLARLDAQPIAAQIRVPMQLQRRDSSGPPPEAERH